MKIEYLGNTEKKSIEKRHIRQKIEQSVHLIVHLKTRENRSRFFATRPPLLMDAFGVCYNHLNKSGFMEVLIYGFERCEYTVSRNKKPLS